MCLPLVKFLLVFFSIFISFSYNNVYGGDWGNNHQMLRTLSCSPMENMATCETGTHSQFANYITPGGQIMPKYMCERACLAYILKHDIQNVPNCCAFSYTQGYPSCEIVTNSTFILKIKNTHKSTFSGATICEQYTRDIVYIFPNTLSIFTCAMLVLLICCSVKISLEETPPEQPHIVTGKVLGSHDIVGTAQGIPLIGKKNPQILVQVPNINLY